MGKGSGSQRAGPPVLPTWGGKQCGKGGGKQANTSIRLWAIEDPWTAPPDEPSEEEAEQHKVLDKELNAMLSKFSVPYRLWGAWRL